MVFAAALLFIAAQAGFLDGPRVLANMALDRWFPNRFATLSDRFVAQNALVVGDAGPQDVGVRLVSAVVGERQVDRPQQRKDVEGQQQDDRRRDEQPRERSIRQSLMASEYGVHG